MAPGYCTRSFLAMSRRISNRVSAVKESIYHYVGLTPLRKWETGCWRRNVIRFAHDICESYKTDFYFRIRTKVVEAPPALRYALARGMAYSVGNGNDYVGSCINMATRLQKMPGVTFSFNRRGIDLD